MRRYLVAAEVTRTLGRTDQVGMLLRVAKQRSLKARKAYAQLRRQPRKRRHAVPRPSLREGYEVIRPLTSDL